MSLIVRERLHAQSVDVCVMCADVLACTFPYSCVCVCFHVCNCACKLESLWFKAKETRHHELCFNSSFYGSIYLSPWGR